MKAFDIYSIEWSPNQKDISCLCPNCYFHMYRKGNIRELKEINKGLVCRYCGIKPNEFGEKEFNNLIKSLKGE